jgi:hypothetical protein
MAITTTATKTYRLYSTVKTLAADQKIKLQAGTTGELVDLLNEQVPTGKTWDIEVTITVSESSVT